MIMKVLPLKSSLYSIPGHIVFEKSTLKYANSLPRILGSFFGYRTLKSAQPASPIYTHKFFLDPTTEALVREMSVVHWGMTGTIPFPAPSDCQYGAVGLMRPGTSSKWNILHVIGISI